MIQHLSILAFFLLLAAHSCQSESNTQRGVERQGISMDYSNNNKTVGDFNGSSSVSSTPVEPFRLDSASLDRFEYNWYRFAFGMEYRWFQKDAVYFPFECTYQDSFGNKQLVLFQSVDSMVAWRLKNPAFFGGVYGDTDRVVVDGYPSATFDVVPFEHFQHIPPTDSILVTYIAPFSKSDYYFKREHGRWIVFRSKHIQYSAQEIKGIVLNRFEDFLLHISSDVTYRLDHTKFPLKDRSSNGYGESVSYSRRKEEKQLAAIQLEHAYKYMTIYPNFSKSRPESSGMYLTVKNEGCACGWSHFLKTGNKWMLVETLNCSG